MLLVNKNRNRYITSIIRIIIQQYFTFTTKNTTFVQTITLYPVPKDFDGKRFSRRKQFAFVLLNLEPGGGGGNAR